MFRGVKKIKSALMGERRTKRREKTFQVLSSKTSDCSSSFSATSPGKQQHLESPCSLLSESSCTALVIYEEEPLSTEHSVVPYVATPRPGGDGEDDDDDDDSSRSGSEDEEDYDVALEKENDDPCEDAEETRPKPPPTAGRNAPYAGVTVGGSPPGQHHSMVGWADLCEELKLWQKQQEEQRASLGTVSYDTEDSMLRLWRQQHPAPQKSFDSHDNTSRSTHHQSVRNAATDDEVTEDGETKEDAVSVRSEATKTLTESTLLLFDEKRDEQSDSALLIFDNNNKKSRMEEADVSLESITPLPVEESATPDRPVFRRQPPPPPAPLLLLESRESAPSHKGSFALETITAKSSTSSVGPCSEDELIVKDSSSHHRKRHSFDNKIRRGSLSSVLQNLRGMGKKSPSSTSPQGSVDHRELVKRHRELISKRRRKSSTALSAAADADPESSSEAGSQAKRRSRKNRSNSRAADQTLASAESQDESSVASSINSSSTSSSFRIIGVASNDTTQKPSPPKDLCPPPAYFDPMTMYHGNASSNHVDVEKTPPPADRSKHVRRRYTTPNLDRLRQKKQAATNRATQAKSIASSRTSSFFKSKSANNVTWFVCVGNESDPDEPFTMLPVRHTADESKSADEGPRYMPHVRAPAKSFEKKDPLPRCADGSRLRSKLFAHDRLKRIVNNETSPSHKSPRDRTEPFQDEGAAPPPAPRVRAKLQRMNRTNAFDSPRSSPTNTQLRSKLFDRNRLKRIVDDVRHSPKLDTVEEQDQLLAQSSSSQSAYSPTNDDVSKEPSYTILPEPPLPKKGALVVDTREDDAVREQRVTFAMMDAQERLEQREPNTPGAARAVSSSRRRPAPILSSKSSSIVDDKTYSSQSYVRNAMQALENLEQRKMEIRARFNLGAVSTSS